MALVEAYRDLDRATRAPKAMVVSSKQECKQDKTKRELWLSSEIRLTELEQRLKETEKTNPLALPPRTPNQADVSTQTEETSESVPVIPTSMPTAPPHNYEEELAA